jgi:hypothetical protein
MSSEPEDLETLNVVLQVLEIKKVEPDFTIENERGADVVEMLSVIKGTPLYSAFGEALQPYMVSYYDAKQAARDAEVDYFDRPEVIEARKAIKQIEDGGGKPSGDSKCSIMFAQIKYDAANSNIFNSKYLNHFLNMDDEKKMNRFNEQFNAEHLPINFDFSPKAFALSSESSNIFSIMVIPSVFEGITMEQIQHYVEKISDYLFSPAID